MTELETIVRSGKIDIDIISEEDIVSRFNIRCCNEVIGTTLVMI